MSVAYIACEDIRGRFTIGVKSKIELRGSAARGSLYDRVKVTSRERTSWRDALKMTRFAEKFRTLHARLSALFAGIAVGIRMRARHIGFD